jgi:hypothetical protein
VRRARLGRRALEARAGGLDPADALLEALDHRALPLDRDAILDPRVLEPSRELLDLVLDRRGTLGRRSGRQALLRAGGERLARRLARVRARHAARGLGGRGGRSGRRRARALRRVPLAADLGLALVELGHDARDLRLEPPVRVAAVVDLVRQVLRDGATALALAPVDAPPDQAEPDQEERRAERDEDGDRKHGVGETCRGDTEAAG